MTQNRLCWALDKIDRGECQEMARMTKNVKESVKIRSGKALKYRK